MRLIIAGSRSVTSEANYQALKQAVMTQCPRPDEIISGGARGPDQMGERLAAEFGVPVKRFIPDWDGLGKGAGFIRNGNMAVYASEQPDSGLVAIWDGSSKGTQQMLSVAETYGLHILVLQPIPDDLIAVKDITPPAPYIFPQSHSSLNVFETCPRQYEAKYITKDVPYVQSAEAKWGDEVHTELERYLKAAGNHQLPANMLMYKPFGDWVLRRAAGRNGTVLAERMSAVNAAKQSVPYKSKERFIGGKIDVTILYPHEGVAEVFDWKTGKVKNDMTQLQLYGALGLADYPEIQTVAAGYIWLAHNQISPPVFYARPEYLQHWETFDHKYARLKDAYTRGIFPPKPNGLCKKWCDVKRCEFWGTGR